MPPDSKNPATRGATGLVSVFKLGGQERRNPNPERSRNQWDEARRLERVSVIKARSALLLRGADRLQTLALASAYASAARVAAHSAGEFQQ